jgi:hypothetical protein
MPASGLRRTRKPQGFWPWRPKESPKGQERFYFVCTTGPLSFGSFSNCLKRGLAARQGGYVFRPVSWLRGNRRDSRWRRGTREDGPLERDGMPRMRRHVRLQRRRGPVFSRWSKRPGMKKVFIHPGPPEGSGHFSTLGRKNAIIIWPSMPGPIKKGQAETLVPTCPDCVGFDRGHAYASRRKAYFWLPGSALRRFITESSSTL